MDMEGTRALAVLSAAVVVLAAATGTVSSQSRPARGVLASSGPELGIEGTFPNIAYSIQHAGSLALTGSCAVDEPYPAIVDRPWWSGPGSYRLTVAAAGDEEGVDLELDASVVRITVNVMATREGPIRLWVRIGRERAGARARLTHGARRRLYLINETDRPLFFLCVEARGTGCLSWWLTQGHSSTAVAHSGFVQPFETPTWRRLAPYSMRSNVALHRLSIRMPQQAVPPGDYMAHVELHDTDPWHPPTVTETVVASFAVVVGRADSAGSQSISSRR